MKTYHKTRKKVKTTCYRCGKSFLKATSEYNRNERMKRHHFCSLGCSGSYRNSLKMPYNRFNITNYIKEHPDMFKTEFTPFRYLFRGCKNRKYRDLRRNIDKMSITIEDIKNLWIKQEGKCAYTGLTMKLPTHTKHNILASERASVDRIDSSKGYIPDNIQLVLASINFAKHTMTDEEMKTFLHCLRNQFINTGGPAEDLNFRSQEVLTS